MYLNVQQLEERLAGSKGLRDLKDEMNHKYTDTEFSFMENFYESPRNWILWVLILFMISLRVFYLVFQRMSKFSANLYSNKSDSTNPFLWYSQSSEVKLPSFLSSSVFIPPAPKLHSLAIFL